MARSLRRQGLRAKAARKFKATTNSNHTLPVAPNLLQQDFSAERPNQKWVSDITYIPTEEGWLCLAVVMDLYSRRVVGWSMSARMRLPWFAMPCAWPSFDASDHGVSVHSDRGSQCCSKEHRRLLEVHGMICSMSARGNCYDNAAMESWSHSLKVEAIHGERFKTRDRATAHVFEYSEVYYNRQRLHSLLEYFSPEEFELTQVA